MDRRGPRERPPARRAVAGNVRGEGSRPRPARPARAPRRARHVLRAGPGGRAAPRAGRGNREGGPRAGAPRIHAHLAVPALARRGGGRADQGPGRAALVQQRDHRVPLAVLGFQPAHARPARRARVRLLLEHDGRRAALPARRVAAGGGADPVDPRRRTPLLVRQRLLDQEHRHHGHGALAVGRGVPRHPGDGRLLRVHHAPADHRPAGPAGLPRRLHRLRHRPRGRVGHHHRRDRGPGMRAIVTGAALAGRLARDGAGVVLLDVDANVAATAERLARDVTGAGAPQDGRVAVGLVADVSDESASAAAVDRAVQALGGVDVLVNNAGIGGPDTDVTGTSLADFRRVLDVNLAGTFLMCRAVAPVMIGQGSGGAIVNMGSVFGQQGVAGGAGYCASKAGVALLTHSLALELAPHGIRVNTIAPGNMATEMHWDELRSRAARSGTAFDEQMEMVKAAVPLGRHGTGDDIAGTVAWLVSPDARYVTGQTIGVNGGIWLS